MPLVKTLINDWNTKIVNLKQQYPRDKAPLKHLKHLWSHDDFFNVVFVVCALKLKGFYATCEVMQRIFCYIDKGNKRQIVVARNIYRS